MTPDELALRLHTLYPHATVVERDGRWHVRREPASTAAGDTWWTEPGLPKVGYDAEGLILEANASALDLLGADLVGRHWQDVVTPGTDVQVARVIELIRVGGVRGLALPAAVARRDARRVRLLHGGRRRLTHDHHAPGVARSTRPSVTSPYQRS